MEQKIPDTSYALRTVPALAEPAPTPAAPAAPAAPPAAPPAALAALAAAGPAHVVAKGRSWRIFEPLWSPFEVPPASAGPIPWLEGIFPDVVRLWTIDQLEKPKGQRIVELKKSRIKASGSKLQTLRRS